MAMTGFVLATAFVFGARDELLSRYGVFESFSFEREVFKHGYIFFEFIVLFF